MTRNSRRKGVDYDDYRGVEWRSFKALENKLIRIYPAGVIEKDLTWVGEYKWIDVYTIGVAFNWVNDPDAISIVYKNAMRIDPIPEHEIALIDPSRSERLQLGRHDVKEGTGSGNHAAIMERLP